MRCGGVKVGVLSPNLKPGLATKFYIVIGVSIVVGLGFDYSGISAVRMLFWSALLNGLLEPPIMVIVVLLTSHKKVMGITSIHGGMKILGWAAAIITSAATMDC
jgi:Mn2+/Fe2+ NRAMP family transporter